MLDARLALHYRRARNHNSQHDTAHKASKLEWLDIDYNMLMCSRVYTDGSSDAAVRTAEVVSTSALAVARHFPGRWLRKGCQTNTELYRKLPDFSTQRHHPCPTLSSLQTANLLSKAYSHPESSWKETHSAVPVTGHNNSKVAVQWVPAH